MRVLKDGRVILSKNQAEALSRVLEHGIVVVDDMEADKHLAEDYSEVRLLQALHACVQLGVTAGSLVGK